MQHHADTYYASADGLRLYARDYAGPHAGAPVLLCLPGLTRNSKDFDGLAAHLSVRYRVLCPDLRGRGRSARDPKPENYRPDVYGGDIFGLLEALRIDTFGVIGTSLGALMAMGMNALAPQRVTRVVLNDAGPELDPRGLARIASYVGKPSAPMTNWAEAAQRMAENYGAAYPDFTAADWGNYARTSCYRDIDGIIRFDYDPGIAVGLANGSATPDLWPVFDLLAGKPVLVLRGEISDLLSEATVAKMCARLPGLRATTIPARGHAPTLDEPAARTAIDDFLAASNGGSPT
ncbi:MAG: alpha/beta hydrolase [Xanthomonadales bacterium PRO7]|jgi:pimeloyl-ACP methyl ester carboxylesterase|nr:alpha/beta hydrolase [Xanthomonadales bacterium PRO7]